MICANMIKDQITLNELTFFYSQIWENLARRTLAKFLRMFPVSWIQTPFKVLDPAVFMYVYMDW